MARLRGLVGYSQGSGIYNPMPPPPPPPPAVFGWKTWSTPPTLYERRRNCTAGGKANAPVRSLQTFHKGEVPAGKRPQVRDESNNIIPTTDWQWGERHTYRDGSLKNAVFCWYAPSTFASAAYQKYKIEFVDGAWPAETDSHTISDITANSDFKVLLEDIHLIGNGTDQPAYSTPNITWSLNTALGQPRTSIKRTGGSIMTQWRIKAKIDSELWILGFVNVWYVPGTNTVHAISFHLFLQNGWARVFGRAKIYKLKVMDGATVLRDFCSTSLNRTAANVKNTAGHWQLTDEFDDFSTFEFRQGGCVKVTGTPPTEITTNKFYSITKVWGGISQGNDTEPTGKPALSLCPLGTWDGNTLIGTMTPGSAGSFNLQTYIYTLDKEVVPLRDRDAFPFWSVGSAATTNGIEVAWETDDLNRRKQTGQIPNSPYEVPKTINNGEANFPENTGGLPLYNHLHTYMPGQSIYHRNILESAGEWYHQGQHLNEVSYWLHNRLASRGSMTTPFARVQRMMAAESITVQRLNYYENSLDGFGDEYGTLVCINNGSNKLGTQYPGMGPCRPDAARFTRTGINGPGYDGVTSEGYTHYTYGGDSGSHSTKEMMFAYALDADPADLEATKMLYISVALGEFYPQAANPGNYGAFGVHRTRGTTDYYRLSLFCLSQETLSGQPRAPIGRCLFLAGALCAPDTDAETQMLKDIADDNVLELEAVYDDPTIFGQRAKAVGVLQSLPGGGQQAWQLQRHATAGLYLIKATGLQAPKAVTHCMAHARLCWGDPVVGPPLKQGAKGHILGIGAFNYFDDVTTWFFGDPVIGSGVDQTIWRFLDSAATVADASTCSYGPYTNTESANAQFVRFEVDGQHMTIRQDAGLEDIFIYDNGDRIMIANRPDIVSPPTGIATNTWYYLYDKTLISRLVQLNGPWSGTPPAAGQTMTQGGVSATIIDAYEYYGWWVIYGPTTGGNFSSGAVTFSGGGSGTLTTNNVQLENRYKVSSTWPSITPATWTGLVTPRGVARISWALVETERNGPGINGQLRHKQGYPANTAPHVNLDYVRNISGPLLVGVTLFGTDTGGAAALANFETFADNVMAYEGTSFYELGYAYGSWCAQKAYVPA